MEPDGTNAGTGTPAQGPASRVWERWDPPPSRSQVIRLIVVTSSLTTLGLAALFFGVGYVTKRATDPAPSRPPQPTAPPTPPAAPIRLASGIPHSGAITKTDREARFSLSVPEVTRALALRAWSPEGALFAGVRFGRSRSAFDWTVEGSQTELRELASPSGCPAMAPGEAEIVLRPADPGAMRGDWTYTLFADVQDAGPVVALPRGTSDLSVETDASRGWCWVSTVPPETAAEFRVDVACPYPLDVLVAWGRPAFRPSDADTWMQSVGTSGLVLGRDRTPPQGAGKTVYVTVLDHRRRSVNVPFRLFVTPGLQAPRTVPPLEIGSVGEEDPRRIWRATARVDAQDGGGSAVFVSAEGHLIGAEHSSPKARPGQDGGSVAVYMTKDPRRLAELVGWARVLETDRARDLALLQVFAGPLGEPLPQGTLFPFVPLADADPKLGAPLTAVGYPDLETGEVSTITLSRGVLAGFQDVHPRVEARFDGFTADGSSGGGIFDASSRLCGILLNGYGPLPERMGGFRPVSDFPPEWRKRFGAK